MHAMEAQASARSSATLSGPPMLAVVSVSGTRVRPAAGRSPSPRSGKPRLRLTRRGRVVVFVFFLLLAAAAITLAATASRAADPARPAGTTVVQEGDTLWSIADRHHPRGDRVAVIEEIRRLNSLHGYTVFVGQELKLPG